jgi:hypothetical protein
VERGDVLRAEFTETSPNSRASPKMKKAGLNLPAIQPCNHRWLRGLATILIYSSQQASVGRRPDVRFGPVGELLGLETIESFQYSSGF